MKRPSRPVIATAFMLAVATPALAGPNAFWTFGWDFPGRGKPWGIARASSKVSAVQVAARPAPPPAAEPAVELGFVLPFDMDGMTDTATATY